MLEIDGSQKSGSGTILRLSVALASILGEPLHIYNIRKKRSEPGLRPQHLESVLTAAKLCNAKVKGAYVGSQELWFEPGEIFGGDLIAEIGTAGSIPMLIMTVLPICAFAKHQVSLRIIKGGTDVRHSPTINYMINVYLRILERIGLKSQIDVKKYGYYPKGMGEVVLRVQPCRELKPIRLEEFGEIINVGGVSVCTFLADRRVAERQAKEAARLLQTRGLTPKIQVINDFSNPLQRGSSLVLWVETDKGALLGSDSIGEIGKTSEAVAQEAVTSLLEELNAKATVDIHMADMLVPYVALAKGESVYLTRVISDHLESNIWLAEEILGVKFHIEKLNTLYRVSRI
ncbi:MAG: RNA 3'-terminal phosphate cyclase [Candidatus Bathyarchaeota archaeon]|nr:RNA 3'-terminal phosphate cyclase [Candidatus Bathyarchaeota archaeon]